MRVGMIVVLAAATLATTDDTGRVVGSALRFAARMARIDASSSPQRHRHDPVALVSRPCDAHEPTTHHAAAPAHAAMHPVAHVRPRAAMNDSLLGALRAGGLVIVFRHSLTDHSQPDSRQMSLTDRTTQRNLTPAGVEQAKHIGGLIRLLRVPVDEVYASPLFRTMDTATNAFGRAAPSDALWRNGTAVDRTRLLTEPPPAGTNRVLVTHNFVLVAMFPGMRPGDLREGDAMVVRPLGDGKYDLVGQIRADDWARLGNVNGTEDHELASIV